MTEEPMTRSNTQSPVRGRPLSVGNAADPEEANDVGGNDMQKFSKQRHLPHVRRKSVIPIDPTVLQELSAHKSLDTVPVGNFEPIGSREDQS